MTKPITSLAADDAVRRGQAAPRSTSARYQSPNLPDVMVWDARRQDQFTTRKPDRPMKVLGLFSTRRASLMGSMMQQPVELPVPSEEKESDSRETLQAQWRRRLAALAAAMLAHRGRVVVRPFHRRAGARFVEIVSGMELDKFFRQRITGPLACMTPEFWCRKKKNRDRLRPC